MSSNSRPELIPAIGEVDHVLGRVDAPITLVEYGDYECPHCAAAQPVVKEVQRIMGEEMRFAFRHFPLTQIHPHAELAAEAAEAAGTQSHFWQMHDLLFENQKSLDDWRLVLLADELGLDVERFRRDVQEHAFHERVRKDFLSGVRSGVNGTPTFFINGVRHDGLWDTQSLINAIESATTVSR